MAKLLAPLPKKYPFWTVHFSTTVAPASGVPRCARRKELGHGTCSKSSCATKDCCHCPAAIVRRAAGSVSFRHFEEQLAEALIASDGKSQKSGHIRP
jgi:hypothetical protein